MRCKYCGWEIPDGILYCENCGKEVRIVPDYNPLDEMLTANIKSSITEGNFSYDRKGSGTSRSNTGKTGRTGRTTGASRSNTDRVGRTAAMRSGQSRTGRTGRTTGTRNVQGRTGRTMGTQNVQGRTGRTAMMGEDQQRRGRRAKQRRERKKRKRRRLLRFIFVFLLLIAGAGAVFYYFSYTGMVRRGFRALGIQNYMQATECFESAIARDEKKPEAYTGMAQVLLATQDAAMAENVFLDAIENQDTNVKLYEACFEFYLDVKQPMKIPELLAQTDEKTKESLKEYIVEMPRYSLDSSDTYDDVQQLSLDTDASFICYTTDGSDPDPSGTKYKAPIQLSEGTTVIKAISVNKKGVPSSIVSEEYVIELPIEDAPAVSPSTGQYSSEIYIEVKVPDGYSAYYTMTGSDPTTASNLYTGPVKMPQGETLFKAVLVNAEGRSSSITTRNYVRE